MATSSICWHSVKELVRCLELLQDYLEEREKNLPPSWKTKSSRKRKSPDEGLEHDSCSSSFDRRLQDSRTSSVSRSPSVSSAATSTSPAIDIYNGVLDADEYGHVFCRQDPGKDVPELDTSTVPTPEMSRIAQDASVEIALKYIRNEYAQRLLKVPGKPIRLVNLLDNSTPSLRFRYISEYFVDGKQNVYRASVETQQGCTQCSPHMGRNIGCEYTKKCDCLEYAAVDESRLDKEGKQAYQVALDTGASTMGFPKKFPYFAEGTKKTGCLVPFYLNSRRPIYECNDKCQCGPYCRNKNVQFGRQVEVEIFRANDGRGWGLRCKEDLHEGQFIDTYRGEVINDAEATRRENLSSKSKASYLYSLDKFAESEGLDEKDLYVVDGEFMGGPTKFINHSCDPNCRQYTVSYNKHDPWIYDIAFFARRYIPKGEELTFDYLDKEEGEEMDEPSEGAIECLCGAANCRKWLWT